MFDLSFSNYLCIHMDKQLAAAKKKQIIDIMVRKMLCISKSIIIFQQTFFGNSYCNTNI